MPPVLFLFHISCDPVLFPLFTQVSTGGYWKKPLTKTNNVPKGGEMFKKLSSSLPDLPPSCPAACMAQKPRSHSRRWMLVRDGHPLAVAWRSIGSVVVGCPVVAMEKCHPVRAATARKSPLVGSLEGCCCWCWERWRRHRPGCSVGSHCVTGVVGGPKGSWVVGRGPIGGGLAPGGAECCRWPETHWWRRSACQSPWWCPSSAWSYGSGTTPWPVRERFIQSHTLW